MLVVAIPPVSVFNISFSAATPFASAILLHSAMLPTVTARLPEISLAVPKVVDPVKVVVGPGVVVMALIADTVFTFKDPAVMVGSVKPVLIPLIAALIAVSQAVKAKPSIVSLIFAGVGVPAVGV